MSARTILAQLRTCFAWWLAKMQPAVARKGRRSGAVHPLEALEARQLMAGDGVIAPDLATVQGLTSPSTASYRSIDGTGNNLAHPEWGSTAEQLLRKAAANYGDGISTPAGADRPNAREISNVLADHVEEDTPNERDLTAYLYVWGQFLDHDLDLTKNATPADPFFVAVPTGDAYFDPDGTGAAQLPFFRSKFDASTGTQVGNPRQQINEITSWIDGSMIYGSDSVRAAAVRTFSGGRLRVTQSEVGDLPPLNQAGLPNDNPLHAPAETLFLAGDERSNENIELTAMHTLFIREHNRIADALASSQPQWSDEEIYQRARAYVIAEIQAVTYNEWLPALLGQGALAPYRGYNANVNPGVTNEFATAGFRLHSTINDDVEFFDNSGRPITFSYTDGEGNEVEVDGEVALRDAFFNPGLFSQTGVDGILKYAASTHAEKFDPQLVGSLRNFLFGQPGQGGLDLASLNIQRGRDHGLADYNTTRASYGLPRVRSFAEITSDVNVQQKLAALYEDVNNIDLWVGAAAEDHLRGSSVGPLVQKILLDQFQRARDGDRFWYERTFSGSQLDRLRNTHLSDILARNTDVEGLQRNVFFFRAAASGTVFQDANGNGRQDRREEGAGNVRVELLNDEGEVVAATRSQRDGAFSFNQFGETGDYQIRIVADGRPVTTANPRSILVAAGDARIRNVNFGLGRPQGAAPLSTPTVNAGDAALPSHDGTPWEASVDTLFHASEDVGSATSFATIGRRRRTS